jgi:hypothetical protein
MAEGCRHHWALSSSAYASHAVCTLCGAERDFTGGEIEPKHWTQTRSTRTVQTQTAGSKDHPPA